MVSHEQEVNKYIEDVLDGTLIVNDDTKLVVQRFLDLKEKYEYRKKPADDIINLIETTITHQQGEMLDGTPLEGTPFLLLPFQKFIVYSIMSFYKHGTKERVVKECLIFIPRKNGKTSLVAGLSWAFSLYYRASGSKCYVVSNALKQSMESFTFLRKNIIKMGEEDNFIIRDNNQEHVIKKDFQKGSIYIQALAASVDKQDSLNANIIIADELHAYKSAKQYNIMKDSTKAYTNKLVIGISTAGDNPNGYLAKRIEYCEKVLNKQIEDDQLFIFIARGDKDANISDPINLQKANPSYGVTIRPHDIQNDALQAVNDPQQRKEFLAKSLNIFTGAVGTYFEVDKFTESDSAAEKKLGIKKEWTLEQKIKHLSKLPCVWYGGADLSKVFDLTAACIYTEYKGVSIILPHAWFPVTEAQRKAEEDGIPLFGWQDDGWLTMCNTEIVNYSDVVKWFENLRSSGFNIKQVSFDKKFGKEFFLLMKRARFKMIDAPQYFWWKNIGFRRIESQVKTKDCYYLSSEAYEYCVANVTGVEKTDDMIQYHKVRDNQRIDIFDASVFACSAFVDDLEVKAKTKDFLERLDL